MTETTVFNAANVDTSKLLDVRPIPCTIKHKLIIRTWKELPVGDFFILLNDHDPVPLRYQFQAEWPGTFTWERHQQGQEEFYVKITKHRELGGEKSNLNAPEQGCSEH
jgi:uncharacterized protein (DUF2249 family)